MGVGLHGLCCRVLRGGGGWFERSSDSRWATGLPGGRAFAQRLQREAGELFRPHLLLLGGGESAGGKPRGFFWTHVGLNYYHFCSGSFLGWFGFWRCFQQQIHGWFGTHALLFPMLTPLGCVFVAFLVSPFGWCSTTGWKVSVCFPLWDGFGKTGFGMLVV